MAHFYEGTVTDSTPQGGPQTPTLDTNSATLDPTTTYHWYAEVTASSGVLGTTSFVGFNFRDNLGNGALGPLGESFPEPFTPLSGSFTTGATVDNPVKAQVGVVHNDVSASSATVYFWLDPEGWIDPGDPPDPPPDPPDIDILDPDLGPLATLDDVNDWTVRVELKDVGSGRLVINRYSSNATDAILKQGNWCQVVIPRISTDPIAIWQLESGKTILLDRDEEGGENVTWGGRGGLSYLERYKAMPRSEVVPAGIIPGGVYVGPASTGGKAGQLLKRFVDEATHAELGLIDFGEVIAPLGLMTHDFDYTNDSDGNAWVVTPSTAELAQGQVGENGLYSASKLINTGAIDIIMQPNLLLQAFNHYGRDLSSTTFASGKVRFVRGVNIAERLERDVGHELAPTHTIVQGQDDVYGFAESPSSASRPTNLGFVQTIGTDTGFLEEVGLADMAAKLRRGESVSFVVDVPIPGAEDELTGKYLPGPPGSNGHFWIGDDVTLHTGSGTYGDMNNETVRIMAVVLSPDKANNLTCSVEVMWTRLLARSTPVAVGVGVSGVRTTSGGTTAPPPPAASTLHGHDHGALSGLTDDDHTQYVRHFIQLADPAGSAREGDLWVEAS